MDMEALAHYGLAKMGYDKCPKCGADLTQIKGYKKKEPKDITKESKVKEVK